MALKIELDRNEILETSVLLDFLNPDLAEPTGYVTLKSDGRVRTWAASDNFSAVSIRGESDHAEYRLLLSPSQFGFLVTAAQADESPVIQIGDDGMTYLNARHADMKASTRHPHHFLFDYDYSTVTIGASGEFKVRELMLHLDSLMLDFGADADKPPTSEVALTEGYMDFSCSVPGHAGIDARLAGRGVSGDVMVVIELHRLRSVLTVFEPDEDVQVLFPEYQGNPVVIRSATRITSVMPWRTESAMARIHVEEVINEVFGHLSVKRDGDGDYPLRRHGNHIFGRLNEESQPVAFQVFGVLLRDVQSSADLLSEINEINTKAAFVKLFHVDSHLLIEVDLVASSLDAIELENAVSKIAVAMEDYASTLSVVFGGAKDEDPMVSRWSAYRSTIVHAETSPGRTEHLNGPDAVVPWPFPQIVHVLSGWNPQGVSLDGEYVNSQIAADVLQMGGRFVLGAGVSPDGTYSEPSLIVWGLAREQAREIGRKANQDAVFEIDDEELRLVACFTDQVEAIPRRDRMSRDVGHGYL